MSDFGKYGMGKRRGPYGTNEGDKWLSPRSPIQDMLDEKDPGKILVNEMLVKDGELQEVVYATDDEELIAEAQAGHERYIAERARAN